MPAPDSPTPAVVAAARGGDPAALDAVLAFALPLVYNIAGRALRRHADVDDVVQETMLRVVRGLRDLKDPGAFRSWLAAITIRQIRDHERERSRTDSHRAAPAAEPADADFAAHTVLRLGLTDQRRDVAEATRWLDDDVRELLALWWLEESGQIDRAALAKALGLSAPHAAVRVHRMKKQLDTARAVVWALRDDRCHSLRDVVRDWDGTPNPLWRKRFARHIRDCKICTPRAENLVPLATLLASIPLVPAPIAISPRIPTALASAKAAAGHSLLIPIAATATTIALVTGGVFLLHHPQRTTPTAVASQPSITPAGPPSHSVAAPSTTPAASTPSTVPTVTTTSTPVTPPSPKKGVCVYPAPHIDQALAASTATWYYTWSTDHSAITAPQHATFVPMIWGAASVTDQALAQAKAAAGDLLAFNEPDLSSQSNMTPDQALALWPRLMATGVPLGSPAVAANGATPGGWLDRFMQGAAAHGYRVDFIALHWYGGDFRTPQAVAELRAYLDAVEARYHKPIWLTEFALTDFAHGEPRFPTEDQQAAFVTASTRMLADLPYLKRYAWFALPAPAGKPSTGLFDASGTPNVVGRAFESAP